MKRSAAPEAPVGVRVLVDDRTLDVECVYVGVINGLHAWEVAYPVRGNVVGLSVKVLPPHTTVFLHGARPAPQ